jgi:uncharacterized protein YoxC
MTDFSDLSAMRRVVDDLDRMVPTTAEALKRDLAAKAEEKKQRTAIDDLEEKVMISTAVAAAASGTPEQTREMLQKARAKAMRAAAAGADTATLDSMVHQMEHLSKVAEENRERERRGGKDRSASAIPVISALVKH